MSRADELYNEIYDYCEEHNCWKVWHTANDWNAKLENNYGVACFTALANTGKIDKYKRYGDKSYSYRIVPTGKIKEMMEQEKRNQERENAEYTISHYDEAVARIRAHYEEMLKQAEEQLNRDLEWERDKLGKAKALLNQYE